MLKQIFKTLVANGKRHFCLLGMAASVVSCAGTAGVGDVKDGFVKEEVRASSLTAVRETVIDVFSDDGFDLARQDSQTLYFSKAGSSKTTLVYGRINGPGVFVEPEVTIRPEGAGKFMLHCNVFMREHSGSDIIDADWKLKVSGKHGYNKLLKQVKHRLEKNN